MDQIKLLLDTDIGGDLDDALALAYLLKQPRCELLGITTVGGQAHRRAELASAVCYAGGRPDIPVHVGAAQPWLVAEKQPLPEQAAALSESWAYQRFAPYNTAIGFLRDTIRAQPGEITLLTIGPLTNIGLLFALDPEIPALLKGLMVMGGSLLATSQEEEWNIFCDPHAAARVLAGAVPLTSVGIDVTIACRMGADACRRRLRAAGGPFAFVDAMAEVFFQTTETVVFHDPLAAALIFEPSLARTRPERLDVELCDPATIGRTRAAVKSAELPHRVAFGGDPRAFFEHYFAVADAGV